MSPTIKKSAWEWNLIIPKTHAELRTIYVLFYLILNNKRRKL